MPSGSSFCISLFNPIYLFYKQIYYRENNYMAIKKMTLPRSLGRQLNFTTGACNAVCQAVLEPYDLSLPQWVILSALWQQSGMTIGDLAVYTGNNAPATSRIVDRMIEKGFLLRKPDKADRRIVRIYTAEAGEALRHLATFFEDINAVLLAGLSEEEADLLFELLARAERNARNWNKVPVAPA
ncbi:MAG: MarR family transcriptional regulator [Hyphomicrobiales bacterium]|nr:MarR family transcriptional regulator [Hyphomicrobiales bacterium]